MRIRTIKPQIWESPEFRALDLFGRLLWIGIIQYVDDNGVGLDSPARIAATVFVDEAEADATGTAAKVDAALWIMSDLGLIRRFAGNGKNFLEIVSFSAHQKIQRPTKGNGYARYQQERHFLRVSQKILENSRKSLQILCTEGEREGEVNNKVLNVGTDAAADFPQAGENTAGTADDHAPATSAALAADDTAPDDLADGDALAGTADAQAPEARPDGLDALEAATRPAGPFADLEALAAKAPQTALSDANTPEPTRGYPNATKTHERAG